MGNLYKALLSPKSRKFALRIQQIAPKPTLEHNMWGLVLGKSFYKSFHLTEAVREPIAVEQWKLLPPATKSNQPLVLMFPKPLDWALLWRTITIASEGGQPMDGRIAIDQGERRWSFTPTSPWTAGSYSVRIASILEDVCGNSLLL
jgi:hypothetical protein